MSDATGSAESAGMAAKVAAFDWSATPLGAMDTWPQSLRTSVSICLNSRFPMFVWWGPDLINIHNDAYIPVLGARRGWALGQPAQKIWTELWPVIGAEVDLVMKGEAVSHVRERLMLERNGYTEETYFTYSHSPILDDDGSVGGLFQVCYDETAVVLAERALKQRVDEANALSMTAEQQAQLFDTALTYMNDLAYLLDRNGRFIYANRPLLALWGMSADEIVGKTFFELPYPSDLASFLFDQVQKVVNTNTPVFDETPFTAVDGSTSYYEYIFSPIPGANGQVDVVSGTSRDVTLRKQAELERERILLELEAERRNLATIVAEAPAFIAVLRGPRHVYELVNDNYNALVAHREVIGKAVEDALPEVADQGFIRMLDNVYETGETHAGTEIPITLGEAGAEQEHVINFVFQALRGGEGEINGIFVHGVDVTESVMARNTIEASERRRNLALETAELGAWTIDLESFSLSGDARFCEIFGLRPEDLNYESAIAAIHPDDRDHVRALVAESMRGQQPVPYEIEHRIVAPDGAERWVFVRGRPNLTGDQLQAATFFGTVMDISDRKRAEVEREQLLMAEQNARADAERAGRMKDEFLATLSHEIRTPLNAILGWALIMQQSQDPKDVQRGIEVIERNARAQAQIVEDLLDMSSIISGKIRLDVQRLNLAGIVDDSVSAARPTADAKSIRLDSIIDPMHGVEVSGDANRIRQILWNLINNAIKFTPRNGQVRVLLERVNSHLEISVIDTGEGITSDFLPYVFDRFRQADASTTRRFGGLGLGLSIVRQLVELHGGTVRVKSAGTGRGSTFVVALPLIAIRADADDIAPRQHPRVQQVQTQLRDHCDDLAGVRVLIIDDEPDARALLQRLLEDCQAEVTAAETPDQFVELVKSQQFDVLVSDIGMPGEDGYSLIKRVRRLGAEQHGNVPAIALTAYARAEDRVKAVSAGFQMHIAKPVEPVELITMVASAAGRTRID